MPLRIVETLLSWIFPVRCEICGRTLPSHPASGVCGPCEAQIPFIPGPHCALCGRALRVGAQRCSECWGKSFHFDRAYACTPYEGKVKELLHAYKFNGRKYLRHFFVNLMGKFMSSYMNGHRFDALASVPLDRDKKNTRGFNQSGYLSAGLSVRLGLPDLSRSLVRRKSAQPQHRASKAARKENVKDCFRVRRREGFQMKKILLVDDILTTGQTASECARAMKQAGASSVTVLACARGI